jgi:uncharacterized protein (DUF885 family)
MKRAMMRCAAMVVLYVSVAPWLHADSLEQLDRDFWNWRAVEQPVSADDIPRLERPAGWVPDWSPATVAQRQKELQQFEERWKKLRSDSAAIAQQVDYRLLGSALARVRWELAVTRGWQRNPTFYVDQTVGAIFQLLLPPPPFDEARSREIVKTMANIPQVLGDARSNLTEPVAPFARLAIDQLQDIRSRVERAVRELQPLFPRGPAAELQAAAAKAIPALESYRDWLSRNVPAMGKENAVGREGYIFFLRNVALLPYTPEQLLEMGHQEWARSVAFQAYEENRNRGLPELAIFKTAEEQIKREAEQEQQIRDFLERKGVLSVPAWVQHYKFVPMPGYLDALSGFGEADDFTGPSRLKDSCVRYINPPSPKLGYFALATAKDIRPDMVHEGVPGHYFQLALSWAHPDPIRRHYYDSGANEGLGFYAEELMLQAGLFDDSPRTREIIYNFMRLRALRVEVDVKLALGIFTIDQAAEYLEKTVPMDRGTARAEASMFASIPGQAISYQIGKLQIINFLADAQRSKGEAFNLKAFHDFLWLNGNVPLVLQRWEYLGLNDDVERLESLH